MNQQYYVKEWQRSTICYSLGLRCSRHWAANWWQAYSEYTQSTASWSESGRGTVDRGRRSLASPRQDVVQSRFKFKTTLLIFGYFFSGGKANEA